MTQPGAGLVVNVLPCLLQNNGAHDLTFWKRANTRFNGESLSESPATSTNAATTITTTQEEEDASERPTETFTEGTIEEDQFYPVYNESRLQEHPHAHRAYRAYLRGRKFYGEPLDLDGTQYSASIFEKSAADGSLNYKDKVAEVVLWEHEKFPSDSLAVEHNFQNQWHDIKEMILVSDIIHG